MRDAQRIGHQRRAALAVRKELDDDGVLVGERMGHRSVGGVGATDGKREQRALEACARGSGEEQSACNHQRSRP